MPAITCNINRTLHLDFFSIQSTSLSLIRSWSKLVYNAEKAYVVRLDARKSKNFIFLMADMNV